MKNRYLTQCRLLYRRQYAVACCFQLQFLRSPIKNLLENIIVDEVDIKTFLKEITLDEERGWVCVAESNNQWRILVNFGFHGKC